MKEFEPGLEVDKPPLEPFNLSFEYLTCFKVLRKVTCLQQTCLFRVIYWEVLDNRIWLMILKIWTDIILFQGFVLIVVLLLLIFKLGHQMAKHLKFSIFIITLDVMFGRLVHVRKKKNVPGKSPFRSMQCNPLGQLSHEVPPVFHTAVKPLRSEWNWKQKSFWRWFLCGPRIKLSSPHMSAGWLRFQPSNMDYPS